MTNWVQKTFGAPRALIGALHLPALPGAPRSSMSFDEAAAFALAEARIYAEEGIDGIVVENHGDAPFPRDAVDPHVSSFAALVASRIHQELSLPVGVNMLRNDAISALGAAAAAGGSFIRVNVLTGVTATDQGLIEGCAERLHAYRTRLRTPVAVLADVDVKFGTPLYAPSFSTLVTSTIQRALADAVIVTGEATGAATDLERLREAREAAGEHAVLAGSGATPETVADILAIADGVIVGSCLKEDGYVEKPVSRERVRAFVSAARPH